MLAALLVVSAPPALDAVTFASRPGETYVVAREAAKAMGVKLTFDRVTGLSEFDGKPVPTNQPTLFDGTLLLSVKDLRPSSYVLKQGAKRVYVDLTKQEFWAWQGSLVVMHTPISSGRLLKDTPPGSYKTGKKERMHISTIYGSKMPFSVHLKGNYFIHGSELTMTTPGSHGCVRLPMYNDAAEWFFGWVEPDVPVVVKGKRPAQTQRG